MTSTVTVKIDNDYSDGYSSSQVIDAPLPFSDDLEDWWEDVVWPETGCGHGAVYDVESCYTATILPSDLAAQHGLVGLNREWV